MILLSKLVYLYCNSKPYMCMYVFLTWFVLLRYSIYWYTNFTKVCTDGRTVHFMFLDLPEHRITRDVSGSKNKNKNTVSRFLTTDTSYFNIKWTNIQIYLIKHNPPLLSMLSLTVYFFYRKQQTLIDYVDHLGVASTVLRWSRLITGWHRQFQHGRNGGEAAGSDSFQHCWWPLSIYMCRGHRPKTDRGNHRQGRKVKWFWGGRARGQCGWGFDCEADYFFVVSCHGSLAYRFAPQSDVVIGSHKHQALAASIELVVRSETDFTSILKHHHLADTSRRRRDHLPESIA